MAGLLGQSGCSVLQSSDEASVQDGSTGTQAGCASGATVQAMTPARSAMRGLDGSAAGLVDPTLPRLPAEGAAATALPLPPQPLTELQRYVASSTGQVLPIYGASLFAGRANAFAPIDHAGAPPDMRLGPNDELRIHIWGQINFNGSLRVSREGDIYLPQAGAVHVAGLTFAEVTPHLRAALDRVFRNYQLSVDMGAIHSIQVYATGWVRQPGQYTLSALSTLVDAVFLSGGPAANGSMRHVELRRGGRVLTDFDLYALLVRGDKSGDAQLQDGDVLFIPAAGAQVAVTGSVRQQAIYEMRGVETAHTLLETAGGRTAVATGARLTVERIEARAHRRAFEIQAADAGSTELSDGDIVHVEPVVPDYAETVTLRGAVANPGHFRWHAGMRLSELMPERDALVSRDYWWRRAQLGLPAPEFLPIIDGLQPQPGGEKEPRTLSREMLELSARGSAFDSLQAPIHTGAGAGPATHATLAGTAASPGTGAMQSRDGSGSQDSAAAANMRDSFVSLGTETSQGLHELLPSPSSQTNWSYAVIERLNRTTMTTELVPFDLGRLVLQHDPSQNLELEQGDVVTVFSQDDLHVPVAQQTKYVQLEGEVLHGGVYSVRPGETLQQLVARAGGLTSNAYLYGANFTRKSTQHIEQRVFSDYVDRLEQDLARNSMAVSGAAGTQSTDTAQSQVQSINQLLISRLRQVQPTGRIVFPLKPFSHSTNDLPDLALEDGDRLVVPAHPATVQVIGAVNYQNAFLYYDGATAADYLRLAGGLTRNADRGKAFILRANGSVSPMNGRQSMFASSFAHQKLFPGDTLVMPERGVRQGAMRDFLNWAQLFSQLSLGAAAISVLH